MFPLTAKIAGRRQRSTVPLTPRSRIELRHERDNAVHSNAVEVLADGQTVGYLEAGLGQLVAPLLDRARPVRAVGRDRGASLDVFIPGPRERIGHNLVEVPSSDGTRTYLVDRRRGVCTCPAGRYVHCRHKKALGIPPKAVALAPAATPTSRATRPRRRVPVRA